MHVEDVVTFFDPTHNSTTMSRDDTTENFLPHDLTRLTDGTPNLVAGQRIEVLGFSGPGDFAPVIYAQSLRVINTQSPFPKQNFTMVHLLMTGTQDSQWVSLRGVVRRQSIESNKPPTLLLNTGEGQILLYLPQSGDATANRLRRYGGWRCLVSATRCSTTAGNWRASNLTCRIGRTSKSRSLLPRTRLNLRSIRSPICFSFHAWRQQTSSCSSA